MVKLLFHVEVDVEHFVSTTQAGDWLQGVLNAGRLDRGVIQPRRGQPLARQVRVKNALVVPDTTKMDAYDV